MSIAGASQPIDNPAEFSGPSFLDSLGLSSQALLPNTETSVAALDGGGLLSGQTAKMGAGLTLPDGQKRAADMSNEDLFSVISQLQGEGAEALASQLAAMLRGQAGTAESKLSAQLSKQQMDEVFAQIRQLSEITTPSGASSLLLQTTVVNTAVADPLGGQSKFAERRLVERLNAILPQQAPLAEAANVGGNLRQSFAAAELARQVTGGNDTLPNTVTVRDSAGTAALTQASVLFDRMAAMSNERQLSADLSNGMTSDPDQNPASTLPFGKASNLLASSGSRPASYVIQAPLLAPQWQTEFSGKVMLLSSTVGQGQNQVAEIRLNPAHMGPIEVRVVMKDDQALITFSAQNGAVRDAIESSLPRLREMFSSSGAMLADASVSEHSLSDRQQQNRQSDSEAGYGRTDAGLPMNDQAEFISQINLSAMSPPGSLDLYA